MRKNYVVIISILFSLGVVIFALLRLGIFSVGEESSINHWARVGQTEFKTVPITSISIPEDAIGEVISQHVDIHKKNEVAVTNGQMKDLIKEISSFLYYRFSQDSVDDYIHWRQGEGYQFKSMKEMIDPWFVDDSYVNFYKIGSSFPENARVEDIFRQFWDAEQSMKKPGDFAKGIATDSKGLLIVLGNISKANPVEPPLDGKISFELWYGGNNITLRNWWNPHHSRDELLYKYDSMPCASVGIVMEFIDGSRRPLDLVYYYDPMEGRWILQSVSENNFVNNGIAGLEY